jgi:hypothetical protein
VNDELCNNEFRVSSQQVLIDENALGLNLPKSQLRNASNSIAYSPLRLDRNESNDCVVMTEKKPQLDFKFIFPEHLSLQCFFFRCLLSVPINASHDSPPSEREAIAELCKSRIILRDLIQADLQTGSFSHSNIVKGGSTLV